MAPAVAPEFLDTLSPITFVIVPIGSGANLVWSRGVVAVLGEFRRCHRGLRWYSGDTPAILRRYSGGTPAVLRRYSGGTPAVLRRYSGGTPAGLQRCSSGAPAGSGGAPAGSGGLRQYSGSSGGTFILPRGVAAVPQIIVAGSVEYLLHNHSFYNQPRRSGSLCGIRR